MLRRFRPLPCAYPPIPINWICLGLSFLCVVSIAGLNESSLAEYGMALSVSVLILVGMVGFSMLEGFVVPGLEKPVVVMIVSSCYDQWGLQSSDVGKIMRIRQCWRTAVKNYRIHERKEVVAMP